MAKRMSVVRVLFGAAVVLALALGAAMSANAHGNPDAGAEALLSAAAGAPVRGLTTAFVAVATEESAAVSLTPAQRRAAAAKAKAKAKAKVKAAAVAKAKAKAKAKANAKKSAAKRGGGKGKANAKAATKTSKAPKRPAKGKGNGKGKGKGKAHTPKANAKAKRSTGKGKGKGKGAGKGNGKSKRAKGKGKANAKGKGKGKGKGKDKSKAKQSKAKAKGKSGPAVNGKRDGMATRSVPPMDGALKAAPPTAAAAELGGAKKQCCACKSGVPRFIELTRRAFLQRMQRVRGGPGGSGANAGGGNCDPNCCADAGGQQPPLQLLPPDADAVPHHPPAPMDPVQQPLPQPQPQPVQQPLTTTWSNEHGFGGDVGRDQTKMNPQQRNTVEEWARDNKQTPNIEGRAPYSLSNHPHGSAVSKGGGVDGPDVGHRGAAFGNAQTIPGANPAHWRTDRFDNTIGWKHNPQQNTNFNLEHKKEVDAYRKDAHAAEKAADAPYKKQLKQHYSQENQEKGRKHPDFVPHPPQDPNYQAPHTRASEQFKRTGDEMQSIAGPNGGGNIEALHAKQNDYRNTWKAQPQNKALADANQYPHQTENPENAVERQGQRPKAPTGLVPTDKSAAADDAGMYAINPAKGTLTKRIQRSNAGDYQMKYLPETQKSKAVAPGAAGSHLNADGTRIVDQRSPGIAKGHFGLDGGAQQANADYHALNKPAWGKAGPAFDTATPAEVGEKQPPQ